MAYSSVMRRSISERRRSAASSSADIANRS
jgi:hypothetical protein